MNNLFRTLLFLLVCGAAAVSIIQIERKRLEKQSAVQPGIEAAEFYLDQAVTTHYNDDGSVHYQVTGEHLEFFRQKDTTVIQRPYFILHSKDGHTWHTRADTAIVLPDKNGVQLDGGVRAWQPERNVELTTASMLLVPAREYAETDKAITIKSVSGTTKGLGMSVDLMAETMKINANVSSSYVIR